MVYSFFVATCNDFFQKPENYYWNKWNLFKIQVMYISEFGSYSFGKKWIYHMISHAMRVLKIYIFPRLEILKVRTTLGTLCVIMLYLVLSFIVLFLVKFVKIKNWLLIFLGKSNMVICMSNYKPQKLETFLLGKNEKTLPRLKPQNFPNF